MQGKDRAVTYEVAHSFETDFLAQKFAKQVAECDDYELAQLFLDVFRDHQPVLEAGCGSGRWCAWFLTHGIRSDGVDWSSELCSRAQREIPKCRFIPSDMQQLPFKDGTYGGLIALGSVEHSAPGPTRALKDFHRVLQPGSIAVITVPFGGPVRRIVDVLARPAMRLKSNNTVRRLFGKRPATGNTLAEARHQTKKEWHPRFALGENGWYFYEYEFNKREMRMFLRNAGFVLLREFVGFGNEGVLHNFGRLAGRWNSESNDVDFTILGRFLRKTIPVSICGHMLCYVVQKPSNRPLDATP
jgi:SAM-dependent methyltransferase